MARASCSTKNGLPRWCDDTVEEVVVDVASDRSELRCKRSAGPGAKAEMIHLMHFICRREPKVGIGAELIPTTIMPGMVCATGWTAAVASAERPGQRPRVTVAG